MKASVREKEGSNCRGAHSVEEKIFCTKKGKKRASIKRGTRKGKCRSHWLSIKEEEKPFIVREKTEEIHIRNRRKASRRIR